ncbi:hypothetical protein [Sodalis sp.]|uniref:hypothetical protein n=1 Tax=Sodalis sp. (in: enterobacteria) TaxID=1898979 RepID=UPI00387364A2
MAYTPVDITDEDSVNRALDAIEQMGAPGAVWSIMPVIRSPARRRKYLVRLSTSR